jgi:serine/threonine-protein kinase
MDTPSSPPPEHASAIRAQVEKMLDGETFRDAQRSRKLLRFIVEAVLQGRGSSLKEYTLGADALERGGNFDPKSDAIARVEASRLRARLTQYYATEGLQDDWRIVLPKGTYVPQITLRETGEPAGVSTSPDSRRRTWIGILAILLLGGVVGALALWRKPTVRTPTTVSPQVRIESGADVEVASHVGNDFALSASGRILVFVGRNAAGTYSLYSRDLTELRARELPGTNSARVPALSPDGQWVMYWAEGELRKTRTDATGRPVPVLRTSDALGIDWIDDNHIVVGLSPFELARIDLRDRSVTPVVMSASARRMTFPQSLLGGKFILGTSDDGQVGNAAVELLDVDTGKQTVLVRGAMFGRYASTGHLLFVRAGTLYAVKFNLPSRAVEGEPQPIMEGVAWSPTFAYAQFAVADNGLLLVKKGGDGAEVQAGWIDGDRVTPLPGVSGLLQWPRLSPDGKKLAVMRRESTDYDLWVYDVDSGAGRKIADQSQDLMSPIWSRDGRYIIYAARTGSIWWSRDDASGVLMDAERDQQIVVPNSVSPDGKWLAYHARSIEHPAFDVWVAPLRAGTAGPEAGPPALFRGGESFETYPSFSPDGRWIAYTSNESGRWEVYVRGFPDDRPSVTVSKAGGRLPIWDTHGKALFFLNEDRRIIAADYAVEEGRFTVRGLRPTGNRPLADTGVIANYDVAAGRVLGLLPHAGSGPSELILLTDFRSRLPSR